MHELLTINIPDTLNVGRGRALRSSLYLAHAAWNKSDLPEMTIVEIGTMRDDNPAAQSGDGWSSILWAWYAQQNPKARVYLIDIEQKALDICHKLIVKHLGGLPINVTLHCARAEEWLNKADLEGKINLLYLDGSDNAEEMMEQFRLAQGRNLFAETSIVNLDDIPEYYAISGKGTLLCPYLINHMKWKMIVNDRDARQMMFGCGDYAKRA